MPFMPIVILLGGYLVKRWVGDRVRSAEETASVAGRKAKQAMVMLLAAVVMSSVLTSLVVWHRTSGNAGESQAVQERPTLSDGGERGSAGSRDGSAPVIEARGSRDAAFP